MFQGESDWTIPGQSHRRLVLDRSWTPAANPPREMARVQAKARDHVSTYNLPFPVLYARGGWWNAQTDERIEVELVGWREFPRRPPHHRQP